MLVTLLGMVMRVSDEQFSNAYHPMLVTLSGMVTLVSDEQLENAPFAIVVTEFGIRNSKATIFDHSRIKQGGFLLVV